jgi:hypothetical protein
MLKWVGTKRPRNDNGALSIQWKNPFATGTSDALETTQFRKIWSCPRETANPVALRALAWPK